MTTSCQLDRGGTLVAQGAAIKSTGGGRFEGWAVFYTGTKYQADSTDCADEYFWNGTDFELQDRKTVPVAFAHGYDPKIGREILGRANFEMRNDGVWAWGKITAHVPDVLTLLEAGQLSFSSSAVSHMTRKTKVGDAVRIDYWPVGEFSFTPSPCSIDKTPVRAMKDFKCLSAEEAVRRQGLSPEEAKCMALRDYSYDLRMRAMRTLGEKCDSNWLRDQQARYASFVGERIPELEERRSVALTATEARKKLAHATELLDRVMKLQETGLGKEFTAAKIFELQTKEKELNGLALRAQALLRDAAAAKKAADSLMRRELRDYVLYSLE
jgi:hypothetical protein